MNYDNLFKWLGAAVLFSVWVALVVLKQTDVDPLVSFITITLGGLAGHGIARSNAGTPSGHPKAPSADLPNGSPRPPLYVPGQSGFSTVMMSLVLFCVIGLIVIGCNGCASIQTQVNAVGDQELMVGRGLICNLRWSTIVANPDVIPGLKALCTPAPGAPSPATLLETKP